MTDIARLNKLFFEKTDLDQTRLESVVDDALAGSDDGELFLIVADQLAGNQDSVTINELGIAEDNFLDFEEGIGFLDGIDANHNIVYKNLRYQQIRWDDRSLVYYVEPNTGQFVQRVTETYVYPDGISATGY